MKYLVIIFLSFAIFSPVFAAKIVPGTVPQVQPLQPAPAGISPGFTKNIQSKGQQIINGSFVNATNSQENHTGPSFLPSKALGSQRWIGWLAALVLAGLIAWFFYKKNKS
jgi:hypothetical protein